jgi:hypothetical protein
MYINCNYCRDDIFVILTSHFITKVALNRYFINRAKYKTIQSDLHLQDKKKYPKDFRKLN